MSAQTDDSIVPSIKYFDELFNAVSSNSIAALHASILRLNLNPTKAEFVYNLLNRAHPRKGLTVLQLAVKVYPKTSLRIIEELLKYGAGTELPPDDTESPFTPLWIAVEMKHPLELVRLLLSFKSDIFFRSAFSHDEKDTLHTDGTGYSLLHLAVKVGADEEILRELLTASSNILLNDQCNNLEETPLMLAVKENNEKLAKFLIESKGIDLGLKESSGFTAYELAAKSHSIAICKLFNYTDINGSYYLEIIEKVKVNNYAVWRSMAGLDIRDLNESDDLLPIEGYWQWIDSDWLTIDDSVKCRLRIRIDINEPFYLKEAIDSFSTSPQTSLNLLLHGLQQESDATKKSRAANYFQRLLKWIDKQDWKETDKNKRTSIGLLDNLSRTDLMISSTNLSAGSSVNNTIGTVPPTHLSNLKIITDDGNSDSDDSLLYCPVCSHRFTRDRESHLNSCLTRKPPKLPIGTRYTATEVTAEDEDCPICYEELKKSRAVVMDCLCRFHEKCIEEWFKRGKQCPFHHE